ncbi:MULTISPECIES: DNA methyltransferase [unclassified Lysobacter]|uniref:DNA methyltransferase n=1 Tax=unclassified Lysobacter TaxID=2635362 RepID=UPI0006FCF41B|nr:MULTISPECIES: DNA methyltransferase [unclassified Lysobacter]KRC36591.1 RNA methyltransferase [Lysobacter sp. Root76]KRD66684.1 RNA methyltransferase [Lysobacter sp. Root96]
MLQEQRSTAAPNNAYEERSSLPVEQLLSNINWNFEVREPAHPIESIHPYPAKFIADIPYALMSTLPLAKGSVVLDPFSGSGTTLLSAQRLGMRSIGIDVNPIACMIARVKTGKTPVDLLEAADRVCSRAARNSSPRRWDIPNLDHWFKPDIQNAISSLLEELDAAEYAAFHDIFRLALSSILVRVSNQESDTRYAAIEKTVGRTEVFSGFRNAVNRIDAALQARDWSQTPARVIQANTLTLDASAIKQKVGLVVTSPPYPNAYEYWLYHKYRMWWLGFDPLAVKDAEIGARAHFFKKEHHTEHTFWDQMRGAFNLIDEVLIKGGYACFVVGRSKIHGRIIDNAHTLEEIAKEYSFRKVFRFDRTISAKRKSFNLSHANIKTEAVIVFEK